MRILVDTNILFSALVFPRSKPARALLYVADNHEIVLCDRNIAELRDILNRKAPKFLPDAEVLLAEMSYVKSWRSSKPANKTAGFSKIKALNPRKNPYAKKDQETCHDEYECHTDRIFQGNV